MAGIQIISEMQRSEMIDEIIEHQRDKLSEMDDNDLKKLVIQLRTSAVYQRLIKEAHLAPEPPSWLSGIFGSE